MGGSGSNAASESGGGQAAEDDRGVTVSGGGTLSGLTEAEEQTADETGTVSSLAYITTADIDDIT